MDSAVDVKLARPTKGDEYEYVTLHYRFRERNGQMTDSCVVVPNPDLISMAESQGRIRRACHMGEYFTPPQTGLPLLEPAVKAGLGLHPHAFLWLDLADTEAPEDMGRLTALTLKELVDRFEQSSRQGWNFDSQALASLKSAHVKGGEALATFVRPVLDARPNLDVDSIYVTREPLGRDVNAMWDLAGFPHMYELAAVMDDQGGLCEVMPDYECFRPLLEKMEPGEALRFDLPVEVVDTAFQAMMMYIIQADQSACSLTVSNNGIQYKAEIIALPDAEAFKMAVYEVDATPGSPPAAEMSVTRAQALDLLDAPRQAPRRHERDAG